MERPTRRRLAVPIITPREQCAALDSDTLEKIADSLGASGSPLCESVATQVELLTPTIDDVESGSGVDLKLGQRGKVVRYENYVIITEDDERAFDERMDFLKQHPGITPLVVDIDKDRRKIMEVYEPHVTLESLRKKRLSDDYVRELLRLLEETFAQVKGNYADFSNLSNFGVVEENGRPSRIIIFEGGKRIGPPLRVEDFVTRVIRFFGTRLERGKYKV